MREREREREREGGEREGGNERHCVYPTCTELWRFSVDFTFCKI